MTEFTPWLSSLGGALIGAAAVLLMALNGRVAGMTGIVSGLIPPVASDWLWRLAFLLGAVAAPMLVVTVLGEPVPFSSTTPAPWLVVSGVIVGVGVYFGSGCTSGHGICGIARLSPRSIVATLTFMATTAITVFTIRHVLEGL